MSIITTYTQTAYSPISVAFWEYFRNGLNKVWRVKNSLHCEVRKIPCTVTSEKLQNTWKSNFGSQLTHRLHWTKLLIVSHTNFQQGSWVEQARCWYVGLTGEIPSSLFYPLTHRNLAFLPFNSSLNWFIRQSRYRYMYINLLSSNSFKKGMLTTWTNSLQISGQTKYNSMFSYNFGLISYFISNVIWIFSIHLFQ